MEHSETMEHSEHQTSTGIHSLKLGMWVVIASECMLFGTLIVNYVIQVYHLSIRPTDDGILPHEIINVPLTSASTFALLMSSVTMVLAVHAISEGDLKKFRKWCFATGVLGAAFLGCQVYEFSHFYLEGLGLTTNVFGSSFFSLTTTHGAHVLVGIIILCTIGVWSYFGKMSSKHSVIVETLGLYWHFVDIVWIIIFAVVYLFVLHPAVTP